MKKAKEPKIVKEPKVKKLTKKQLAAAAMAETMPEATVKKVVDSRLIRISIRSLQDMQQLRVQNGNRLAAAFRAKLGLLPSQKENEDAEALKLLTTLRDEYKRITDGVKKITTKFKSDSKIITSHSELVLIEAYEMQIAAEHIHSKAIADELLLEPIWTEWLVNVRGVGPLSAGVIVSEIDIHKCNSISALYKYCGLDVVTVVNEKTGESVSEGRNRTKAHLVPKHYIDKDGEPKETEGISYNPLLKTKMVFVLADVFIKLGGVYRVEYDNYKHRYQNHPAHMNKTPGHIHAMARRAMIKEFLADLWYCWRILEGLPVRVPYAEEKLGIKHSKPKNMYVTDFEKRMAERGVSINYVKPLYQSELE